MAKCTVCVDYDNKLNQVEPCERDGWPELDDLCPEHFREFIIGRARDEVDKAEAILIESQHRLYLVEVAMGLRSKPYVVNCPSTVGDERAATPRVKHVTREQLLLSRRVRPSTSFGSSIEDDFKEEME